MLFVVNIKDYWDLLPVLLVIAGFLVGTEAVCRIYHLLVRLTWSLVRRGLNEHILENREEQAKKSS